MSRLLVLTAGVLLVLLVLFTGCMGTPEPAFTVLNKDWTWDAGQGCVKYLASGNERTVCETVDRATAPPNTQEAIARAIDASKAVDGARTLVEISATRGSTPEEIAKNNSLEEIRAHLTALKVQKAALEHGLETLTALNSLIEANPKFLGKCWNDATIGKPLPASCRKLPQ